MTNKALILFSGGQDSTTCLAWSLEKFDEVYTLGFDYGQRHSIELECRKNILKRSLGGPLLRGLRISLKSIWNCL